MLVMGLWRRRPLQIYKHGELPVYLYTYVKGETEREREGGKAIPLMLTYILAGAVHIKELQGFQMLPFSMLFIFLI